MTRVLCLWAVMFACVFSQSIYAAGHMVVVTNIKNKQKLTRESIRAIFMDRQLTWQNGENIKIYHLPKDSPLRRAFSEKVLNIKAEALALQWIRRENSNLPRNEKHETNEQRAVRLIARYPNAIGYLSRDAVRKKPNLRIVYSFKY